MTTERRLHPEQDDEWAWEQAEAYGFFFRDDPDPSITHGMYQFVRPDGIGGWQKTDKLEYEIREWEALNGRGKR